MDINNYEKKKIKRIDVNDKNNNFICTYYNSYIKLKINIVSVVNVLHTLFVANSSRRVLRINIELFSPFKFNR